MLNILPLAFAAAVYPTLLAGVIVMLGRPAPRPLLVGFLLGGVIISMLAGCTIVFALGGSVSTSSQRSASPVVDLVGGLLAVAVAVVLARKPDLARARRERRAAKQAEKVPEEAHESFTTRMLARGSARSAFALGLVLNLPGVWYLVALKDIAKADYSVPVAVLLMLLFNAIMFLLVEIPLLGYLFDPEGTRLRVERFQAWLSSHAQQLGMWISGAVGCYLVVKGIAGLT